MRYFIKQVAWKIHWVLADNYNKVSHPFHYISFTTFLIKLNREYKEKHSCTTFQLRIWSCVNYFDMIKKLIIEKNKNDHIFLVYLNIETF